MNIRRNSIISLLIGAAMIFGSVDSFSENRPGQRRTSISSGSHRQTNSRHKDKNGRPNKHSEKRHNNRPNNRPNNNRPNNRPNRPDNNRPNNNRPNNNRPNFRPGNHNGGFNRPTSAPRPGVRNRAPRRYPSRPSWVRPLPPRPVHVYRHRPGVPAIRAVLGLNFGSSISANLNVLLGGSYNVTGYAPDAIFLNNVFQFGYTWPDVTLYYGSNGLSNGRFLYTAAQPGRSRFNAVYNNLCSLYGTPVSTSTNGGVVTVTWWGGNEGYVTLQYGPGTDANGNFAYCTDIIFGN